MLAILAYAVVAILLEFGSKSKVLNHDNLEKKKVKHVSLTHDFIFFYLDTSLPYNHVTKLLLSSFFVIKINLNFLKIKICRIKGPSRALESR